MRTHAKVWPLLTAGVLAIGIAACEQPVEPGRDPSPPLFSNVNYNQVSTTGVPYADIGNGGAPFNAILRVHAINSRGDLMGHQVLVFPPFGAITKTWHWRQGTWTDVGSLVSGAPTFGYSMNDNGDVVGRSAGQPFLWTAKKGMVDLSTVGLPVGSAALGINNRGAIVGTTPGGSVPASTAFLWTKQGGVVLFPPLAAGINEAWAVNERGDVVGLSGPNPPFPTPPSYRAVLWTDASTPPTDLGTFTGTFSRAWGVNSCGQVAGDARDALGNPRPFFWSPQTGKIDLGGLGGTRGFATGINNKGHVTGYATNATGTFYAFVWSQATGMINLGGAIGAGPDIAFSQSRGWVINNRGQVAATMRNPAASPDLGTTVLFDVSGLGLSDANGCG